MIKEVGTLFVKSLQHQQSRQEIGVSNQYYLFMVLFIVIIQKTIIIKVDNEGRNRLKCNKARTFCYNRLTDLRCQER